MTMCSSERKHWAGAGGGPAFGREVAHLALDDAWIVPAATAFGGHRGDLDQDQFSHASALARGTRRVAPAKTRRGREGDDPHGMDEGQRVRVTGGVAAGLDHQAAQRQVDEQQGVEFLFGQVGASGA
jgi:hypothetical protein